MTPDQLEIAAAFERLTFEDSRCKDAVFVRAIAKLAKRTPTAELNDGQDKSLRDIVDRYRRQFPVGFVIKHGRRLSKTIQWMAPDLAKAGLINDEAWRADHAARIVGLFPHKSMHQVASIFAAIHPVAADFIEKAPVLVLFAAQGSSWGKHAERDKACREWIVRLEQACEGLDLSMDPHGNLLTQSFNVNRGGRLRKLMESVGLPYALRKLHPSILESNQWPMIDALCGLEREKTVALSERQRGAGGYLADLIPEREDQKAWLDAIFMWIQATQRRFGQTHHLDWAVRQYHPGQLRRVNQDVAWGLNNIQNIADFAGTLPQRFNPTWTIGKAVEEAGHWHTEIARASHEQKFFLEHNLQWDEGTDYTPFPTRYVIDDYEFVALRSGQDLFEEGREMHHCVGSYSKDVISGRARIFGMRAIDSGRRLATIELTSNGRHYAPDMHMRPLYLDVPAEVRPEATTAVKPLSYRPAWHMVQAKGPCNAPLTKDQQSAAVAFTDRMNHFWAVWDYENCKKDLYAQRLEVMRLMPNPPMLIIDREAFPNLDQDWPKEIRP
jgi:hypothetical protein